MCQFRVPTQSDVVKEIVCTWLASVYFLVKTTFKAATERKGRTAKKNYAQLPFLSNDQKAKNQFRHCFGLLVGEKAGHSFYFGLSAVQTCFGQKQQRHCRFHYEIAGSFPWCNLSDNFKSDAILKTIRIIYIVEAINLQKCIYVTSFSNISYCINCE